MEEKKERAKEKCVLCWKEVEYSLDTPIEARQFYVEGAGQLCEACYKECLLKGSY